MIFFESESVELKREWNKDKCLKEIVAFLNTRDGVIYIGVNDDGTIYGVKELEKTFVQIKDSINDMIAPLTEMLYELTSLFIDNKHIVVINIKKGNKLFYIKKYGKSSAGCFYRNGTSCVSMTENEIDRRLQLNITRISLKDIPTIHSDLSFKTMKILLNENGYSVNENKFLEIYNLLTIDKKFNLLSWLVSDDNITPLIVSIFDGIDKSNFIERKDFGNCSLLLGVNKVIDYFEAINKVFIDINKTRKELTSFDNKAFREAWINACVHNKWELNQAPQIYKYSNRIEIISWGGLPNNLTKEEFLSGLSRPVNIDLMDIFLKCDLCERSGFGVPTIVKKYGINAFSFYDDRIVVTIPIIEDGFNRKSNSNNQSTNHNNFSTNKKTSVYDMMIQLIKENNTITRKEIAQHINKSVRTVARMIAKSEKIKYVGKTKQGHWEIIE